MKIKSGDKVQIIAGSYKGSIATVSKVLRKDNKVILEGVNMVKKHVKPTQLNPDGGIVEKEAAIHVSNVMLYDEKAKKASKVSMTTNKKGQKVRVFKKSGTELK